MNDIKRIADLMYQSVIQNNLGILKAGLVVIATDQTEMVKSSVYFSHPPLVYGAPGIDEKIHEVAKKYGHHLYHLDNVKVIIDVNQRVRAALLHSQCYMPYLPKTQYQSPSVVGGLPGYYQQENVGGRVEIVGFSDVNTIPEDVFSLYNSLCEVLEQEVLAQPVSNQRAPSNASHNDSWDNPTVRVTPGAVIPNRHEGV